MVSISRSVYPGHGTLVNLLRFLQNWPIITIAYLLYFGAVRVSAFQGNCEKIHVRKEIRQLSDEELQRFKSALQKLYTERHPTSVTNGSYMDHMTQIHIDHMKYAHGNLRFLPWHRFFTSMAENFMQKFDPDVTIPYFDSSLDAEHPEASVVLTPAYLGLEGDILPPRHETGDEVFTPPSSDTNTCSYPASLPKPHCAMREYNETQLGYFYNTYQVEGLVKNRHGQTKTFADFSRALEIGPHGVVHMALGNQKGDLGNPFSTNDPLFWVHHSYVDKVWHDRQKEFPHEEFKGFLPNGQPLSLDSHLEPFQQTVRIRELLDIESLCYRYEESPQTIAEHEKFARLQRARTKRAESPPRKDTRIQSENDATKMDALRGPIETKARRKSTNFAQGHGKRQQRRRVEQRALQLTKRGVEMEVNMTMALPSQVKNQSSSFNITGLSLSDMDTFKTLMHNPTPIAAWYARKMGYDLDQVRDFERYVAEETAELNEIISLILEKSLDGKMKQNAISPDDNLATCIPRPNTTITFLIALFFILFG